MYILKTCLIDKAKPWIHGDNTEMYSDKVTEDNINIDSDIPAQTEACFGIQSNTPPQPCCFCKSTGIEQNSSHILRICMKWMFYKVCGYLFGVCVIARIVIDFIRKKWITRGNTQPDDNDPDDDAGLVEVEIDDPHAIRQYQCPVTPCQKKPILVNTAAKASQQIRIVPVT